MTTSVVKRRQSGKWLWVGSGLILCAFLAFPMWMGENLARHDAVELSGRTMGTTYSIRYVQNFGKPNSGTVGQEIENLLESINQQMSTYLPDSELSSFNAGPANEWFKVSRDTAHVAERALHYHKITEGASDVTVGPIVNLWKFGPGRRAKAGKQGLPSEEKLAETLSRTGAEHLEVKLDPPALCKSIAALEVDLSSIAKGYAVDKVAELLQQRRLEDYMVEIGGEVRAAGTRIDGKPWRIGVEKPDFTKRTLHTVVELKDQALATSGDYRNFRHIEGQRVSHIIDPSTGQPLPYRGWSVTLLTPTCLEADALATALLVMGEDRGYDWCEKHEVAALFLIAEQGEISERATPKFPELIPLRR